MIIHQVYALISGERIMNICVCDNYEVANVLARDIYGLSAFAVDCLQYRCNIGDLYKNGKFYCTNTNGEEIELEYIPTAEEQVITLTSENEKINEELTTTQLALTEQYEENIILEERLSNIETILHS